MDEIIAEATGNQPASTAQNAQNPRKPRRRTATPQPRLKPSTSNGPSKHRPAGAANATSAAGNMPKA